MLFKGTWARSASKLKEAIEGVGGSLNGFTADEATCYMVTVPSEHAGLGLDILTDMVLNPRFDDNDIAKEKFVISEEIKMYKDQPADHVMELLNGIMWPGNSMGRPLTGTISTVQSLRKNKLISFKEDNYHPANIAVIAAGKVDPNVIIDKVSGSFKERRRKKPSFTTPAMGQKDPRTKFSGDDTNQTHLAMGFPANSGSIRERFATKLMSVILGGNMSSRLFDELREKHGLCYDIASSYKRHRDVGEFVVHAGVDNRKVMRSVMAIIDELRKIRDVGVTPDELLRAKEFAKGQLLLALENTSARMVWFGDCLMIDGMIRDRDDILKEVDNVTVGDIKSACKNIFKPSLINLAMVGRVDAKNKSKIKKELGKL